MPDAPVETAQAPNGAPETEPVEPAPDPEDKPLGEGGEKALRREREARKASDEARKASDKALAELKSDVAPLLEFVKGLRSVPGEEPSDTEKLAAKVEQLETENAKERLGRLRLEVATAKGLTSAQAARLQGETTEELEADAEALLELFPTQTTPETPPGPRGDPAQGARPGGTSGGIQSGAAKYEARKKQGPTY